MTNPTPPSASTDNEQMDELKKFVNGWLIEVAFGVYDREDLPRLADKLISEIAHHTKEAVEAAIQEYQTEYEQKHIASAAELAAPAIHKTGMEGGAKDE